MRASHIRDHLFVYPSAGQRACDIVADKVNTDTDGRQSNRRGSRPKRSVLCRISKRKGDLCKAGRCAQDDQLLCHAVLARVVMFDLEFVGDVLVLTLGRVLGSDANPSLGTPWQDGDKVAGLGGC